LHQTPRSLVTPWVASNQGIDISPRRSTDRLVLVCGVRLRRPASSFDVARDERVLERLRQGFQGGLAAAGATGW
jgi:hypothetical protein